MGLYSVSSCCKESAFNVIPSYPGIEIEFSFFSIKVLYSDTLLSCLEISVYSPEHNSQKLIHRVIMVTISNDIRNGDLFSFLEWWVKGFIFRFVTSLSVTIL